MAKAREQSKEEWSFVNVPPNERIICFHYELSREVALQEVNSELEKAVFKLREAIGNISFDEGVDRGFFLFFRGVGFMYPVLYPEWPRDPYVLIDRKEGKRRAKRVVPHNASDSENVQFLLNQRPGDRSVTLYFPSNLHQSETMPLFDSLVKHLFARGNKKRGGKPDSPDYQRDRLFALAALRLRRHGLSRNEIVKTLMDEKSPRYSSVKALDRPFKNGQEWLEDCRFVWPRIIKTYVATSHPTDLVSPKSDVSELQLMSEARGHMLEAWSYMEEARKYLDKEDRFAVDRLLKELRELVHHR
jgi:hypothetical protein